MKEYGIPTERPGVRFYPKASHGKRQSNNSSGGKRSIQEKSKNEGARRKEKIWITNHVSIKA